MTAYYANGASLSSHVDVSWRFNGYDNFTIRDIVEIIVPVVDYCGGANNFIIATDKTTAYLDKDGDKRAMDMFNENACLYITPDY